MPGYQGCRNFLLIALLAFIVFLLPCCSAQDSTGLPRYGSSSAQKVDTINLSNLNVHVDVPLFQKQSRGYSISYELSCDTNFYSVSGSYSQVYSTIPGCNVNLLTSNSVSNVEYSVTPSLCDPYNEPYGPYGYFYSQFITVDQNNTPHAYNVTTEDYTECGGSITTDAGYAVDGSGYYLAANGQSTTITDPGGITSTEDITAYPLDTNGNMIAESISGDTTQFTDSSGAIVTLSSTPFTQGNPYTVTMTYKDSNGNNQSIVANYQPFELQATFGEYYAGDSYGPVQADLLTSVSLPDRSSYQITYEPSPGYPGDTTGRVASITLPSGGVIGYQYTGGYNGFLLDGYPGEGPYGTAGLVRTTSDGTTTFSRTVTMHDSCSSTSCETIETQMQDGQGNQTVVDFASSSLSGMFRETKRRVYHSGSLLLTTMRCYNGDTGDCTTSVIPLANQDVSEIDLASTPTGAPSSRQTTFYNLDSLPTEMDEYDYGASSPTRMTTTSYASLGNNIRNRPHQVTVYDVSGYVAQETTYGYDESALGTTPGLSNHIAVSGSRGNLTSTHEWINASGSTFDTAFTYDDAGALLTKTDPNGTTTYGYDSSDTFVTSVLPPTPSSGVPLPSYATWDVNTGLITSATDANNETTHFSYDGMLRPKEIDYPDGGKTVFNYTSPALPLEAETMRYSDASHYADSRTELDGYGRISRVATANGQGSNPWYQTDYCYDANGRLQFESYPYQGAGFSQGKVCSGAGDTFGYDALGRATQVTHGDSTSVNYQYAGRATAATDEAGVQRITQVDGLGRTAAVCEISSNGSMPGSGSAAPCGLDFAGTGFLTTYAYDLAGHKTTVTQGAQTRVFQTDFLGRTTFTQEPERGNSNYSYGYNSTGLLVTRTRPRANQGDPNTLTTTTTQYDAVGRVVSVGYDGASTKIFNYDQASIWGGGSVSTGAAKGRLTAAWSPPAEEAFVYDAMGRVVNTLQCLPGWCGNGAYDKWTPYGYDWLGNLLTAQDGAGVTTSYTYSPASEVQSISSSLNDGSHPGSLVSNVQNGPDGPISYQLGNGLNVYRTYDGLGRVQGKWVCTGPGSVGCGGSAYQILGYWISWRGTQLTFAAGDGNLDYRYDEFNRLSSMTNHDTGQQLYSYVYDRYGNRWQQNPQQGGNSSQLTFDVTTNHINGGGYTYDAAGNLTWDGTHNYSYDPEGNITQVDGGGTAIYTYDALNRRVRVDAGGAGWGFVYNLNGQRVSYWNMNAGNQQQGQSYWGRTPIVFDQGLQAHFQHQNWLGSERVRTTYYGAVEADFSNLPFGEESASSGPDNDAYHFAQLDSDSESQTDHAQFRQYADLQGRWMSPDPYADSYDFTNPQSLNRYSYVLNNPLSLTDPLGLLTLPPPPGDGDDGGDDCLWCWDLDGGGGGSGPTTQQPPPPPPYTVRLGYRNPNDVPSNVTNRISSKQSQCLKEVAKKDGVALTLDLAGDVVAFIPGGGLAVTSAQMGVAVASTVNSAINRDRAGSMAGIAGFQVAPIAPAAEYVRASWAKAVPIVGAAVSMFSTVHDAIAAYGDYRTCMAEHQ